MVLIGYFSGPVVQAVDVVIAVMIVLTRDIKIKIDERK